MAMKRSTPLTRNIGAKVKYYRKLRGLSQKQLAAQLQTQRLRYHGDHAGPHRDGLPLHFHF